MELVANARHIECHYLADQLIHYLKHEILKNCRSSVLKYMRQVSVFSFPHFIFLLFLTLTGRGTPFNSLKLCYERLSNKKVVLKMLHSE